MRTEVGEYRRPPFGPAGSWWGGVRVLVLSRATCPIPVQTGNRIRWIYSEAANIDSLTTIKGGPVHQARHHRSTSLLENSIDIQHYVPRWATPPSYGLHVFTHLEFVAALPRRGRIAILDDTLPAPQWLGNKVATAQFSFFQGGFYGTTQVSDALVVTVVEENRNPQELLLVRDSLSYMPR